MKKLLLFGILGLIVVGGSYSLGLFVASNTDQNAANTLSPLSLSVDQTSNQSTSQSETPSLTSIPKVGTFEELESLASHFDRTVALHQLLGNANEETLLQRREQIATLSPSLRAEAREVLVQRLATLNTKAAWDMVSERQPIKNLALVAAIFREWAVANLDQAIEQAQSLDRETKNVAVESMLLSREDLSTEQRREIARQLNAEWLAVEAIERTTSVQPILDPAAEWSSFLQRNSGSLDSPNNAQLRMMSHVATAWIQQEGTRAFDRVIETLPTQSAVWNTSARVVNQIAVNDPQQAFELAMHMRSQGVIGLIDQITAMWANEDPWSTLNAVSSIEATNLKRKLQDRVMQSWANSNPNEMLERAGRLPESLQSLARKKSLMALSRTSPQRAAEMIGELRDQASRDEIALSIARNWSASDITSVLSWIENEPSFEHNRSELISAAFSGLARVDPRQALQVALTHPLNEEGEGPEAGVVISVSFIDMDTAINMLSDVRAGKTKIKAYERVIGMLSGINKDNDRAVDLLVQLTREEVIPRDAWVLTGLVFNAPRGLYDALDRFEPMDLKRRVAKELLRFHEHDDTFTSEQINVLKEVEQYDQANRDAREQDALNRYLDLMREAHTTDEDDSE